MFEVGKVRTMVPLVVMVCVPFPVKEVFDVFVAGPVINYFVDCIFELLHVRILRRRRGCLFAFSELRGSVIRFKVFDVDDRVRLDCGG
jgi:hypothetical protein